MRVISYAAACALMIASTARADDDETVRTKNGAEYRGEIIERVPGDHVTMRMPGLIKRIEWADVDTRPPVPTHDAEGLETVRLRDGSAVRGELVERVAGDHVVLRIATGAMRRLEWRDIDTSAPATKTDQPASDETVETIRTHDGSVYRGVIVERIVGDHVLVRIVMGAIRRVEWRDIDVSAREPAPSSADVETVHTRDGGTYRGEVLEKVDGDHVVLRLPWGAIKRIEWSDFGRAQRLPNRTTKLDAEASVVFRPDDETAALQHFDDARWRYVNVCTGGCTELLVPNGVYRVAGDGLLPTGGFPLRPGVKNVIDTSMTAKSHHYAGTVLVGLGAPFFGLGTLFLVLGAATPSWESLQSASLAVGASLSIAGATMLVSGIVLLATSHSNATVNGHAVGLRKRTYVGVDGLHF